MEGDYVDVRGVLEDCDSKTMTTDIVRAGEDGTAKILGIPNILLTGKTEKQIELQIRNKYKNPTQTCRNFAGKTITKLQVNILRTEEELEPVSMRRSMGLPFGETGHCTPLEHLEPQNKELELMEQALLRNVYNKAFKYVPGLAALHRTRAAHAPLN